MHRDYLIIEGGRSLKGEVLVSGSKNSSLALIFASLLSEGESLLEGVPELLDVRNAIEILKFLGAKVKKVGNSLKILPKEIGCMAPDCLVRKMRASVMLIPPLLKRKGRAVVSMPGGCAIGVRPIDQHLKYFKRAGVEVEMEGGYLLLRGKKLRGCEFTFDRITVTGTMNALMLSSCIEEETYLHNVALEPEVLDLVEVLKKMGARISLKGRSALVIGKRDLKPFKHRVIPDRIEAGTLLVAGAITKGEVVLRGAIPEHLKSVIEALRRANQEVLLEDGKIYIRGKSPIKPLSLETREFPGFPTDMQAQFMALLCVAEGRSLIRERIFENRFKHVGELLRMGARIYVKGDLAQIEGVKKLYGAEVFSTDLRASAGLVLAGLRAEGITLVKDIYHLDRGYERLEEKLKKLGAKIERETQV